MRYAAAGDYEKIGEITLGHIKGCEECCRTIVQHMVEVDALREEQLRGGVVLKGDRGRIKGSMDPLFFLFLI